MDQCSRRREQEGFREHADAQSNCFVQRKLVDSLAFCSKAKPLKNGLLEHFSRSGRPILLTTIG
jgi:hypothetical protein